MTHRWQRAFETLAQDARLAVRMLRKEPGLHRVDELCAVVIVVAALVAMSFPARRAIRVDPLTALRRQ